MSQTTPNYYQFSGSGPLHITFAPDGVPDPRTGASDGQPHFIYQDAQQTKRFVGNQVRIVPCDLGRLVSVTLVLTIDSGSTSFSLLVPTVQLLDGAPQPVQTEGITTVHRFSIPVVVGGVIQPWNIGQDDLYTFTKLTGSARTMTFRPSPV